MDTLRDTDEIIVYTKVKKLLEFKQNKIENLSAGEIDLHKAPDESSKFNLIDKYLWDCVYNDSKVEEETYNFSLRYLKENQKDEVEEIQEKVIEKTRVLLFGEEAD